jgi:hypothetical protein
MRWCSSESCAVRAGTGYPVAATVQAQTEYNIGLAWVNKGFRVVALHALTTMANRMRLHAILWYYLDR